MKKFIFIPFFLSFVISFQASAAGIQCELVHLGKQVRATEDPKKNSPDEGQQMGPRMARASENTSRDRLDSPSRMKMYFILLRAYKGKSGDVFVDLKAELTKFKEMGVNALWLSPPQPQVKAGPPMFALNDHGYWPSDHGKIDPALGSEANFKKFVLAAQEMGISIAIDAVLNHFGYSTEAVINGQRISTSDPTRFVVFEDIKSTYHKHGELNGKIEQSRSEPEIMALREDLAQYPLYDLPTIRKDVPENVDYLINSFKRFVDMGVTTFRIDAAKHMPKDFLTRFSNEINAYSIQVWRRPARFIWEAYITTSEALSIFAKGSVRNMKDKQHTYFYDFPMREEFKRLLDPEYRFEWLKGFIDHRNETNQPTDKFLPLVEDHDNGSSIASRFHSRLIYTVTEFFSENSSFLYHGSEQTGARTADRPVIEGFNPKGDLAQMTAKLSLALSKYRMNVAEHTVFRTASKDLLVADRRIVGKSALFLLANKGDTAKEYKLPLKYLFEDNRYSLVQLLNSGDAQYRYDPATEMITVMLPPQSLLGIEALSH